MIFYYKLDAVSILESYPALSFVISIILLQFLGK